MDHKQEILKNKNYMPPLTKRNDFDDFWSATIEASKKVPLKVTLERVDYPSTLVEVYNLTYEGYDHTIIHGWYLKPVVVQTEKLPCLIHYPGFGGGKGYPHDYFMWTMLGIAVIAIDCRLQGGTTGSNCNYESGMYQNVNSLGIQSKENYYYRAVYMDCMRAIDVARQREEIDHTKLILHGISQGGGISAAIAALDQDIFAAFMDVPSNSNIEARIEGAYGSYACLHEYLKQRPQDMDMVYETVSYFDIMNLADKIRCPVYASVALKDTTCPAICFFATYNRIQSPKKIAIYPFNGHDGCKNVRIEEKMKLLQKIIKEGK